LRPGKSQEAIEVAERENAVISLEESVDRYKDYSDEQLILATMAQSAFMKESEDLANITQQVLKKKLSSQDRGVHQAGFYVLVGASMPNVLVEVGYITNRREEKMLSKESYRRQVAEGLYESTKFFKEKYEKLVVSKYD
jgi:N-acetylmuramoyl-L-alanine amidase